MTAGVFISSVSSQYNVFFNLTFAEDTALLVVENISLIPAEGDELISLEGDVYDVVIFMITAEDFVPIILEHAASFDSQNVIFIMTTYSTSSATAGMTALATQLLAIITAGVEILL